MICGSMRFQSISSRISATSLSCICCMIALCWAFRVWPASSCCTLLDAGLGSVPDPDHNGVDVGTLELLAHLVEFVEVVDGSDAHPVPHLSIHRHALHLGIDPELAQAGTHAVGLGLAVVGADLQHVDSGPLHLGGTGEVALDVLFLLRDHDLE